MKITFKSGRALDANCGIVGLSPELEVSHGYDGSVRWPPTPGDEGDPESFTAGDMLELADTMIERWQRFKTSVHQQRTPPETKP